MRALFPFLLFVLAVACSQRVTPEDEYAARARERPLLPASAAPVEPAGTVRAPAAASTADAVTVSVEWPAPPGETAASSDVLFLFARPVGATSGPPLAVRRIPAPVFPVTIAIGPADAMIPGTVFPERVTVEARLDRDGDASTEGPGDWVAASAPVAPGGEARLVLAPLERP